MKKVNRVLFGLGSAGIVAGMVVTSGCKSAEEYREERAEYAVKHFELAKYRDMMEGDRVNLSQCIKLALEHNLDMKVLNLEKEVAREMRTADMLGMLPELNVTNTYTGRDNTPASSSKKVGESGLTYGYSTSQDRHLNYLNVDLALSVLDFGLAFFNTQQGEDRVLMREQREIRAGQNLSLDVAKAYFQVAAAQKAIKITTSLLEDCRSRYEVISKLSKSRDITPFRAFEETRRFVDMEKRLTNYIRTYENSCVELRSLLGMRPAGKILVDDSMLNKVPEFNSLPDIELMEQIALLQRPELYEIDMQKHINVIECRKTILMMLPNVRIYTDFTNSTNSFLYHMSWYELGIRAAYNLLKLPQQIARYQAYSSQVDAEEARTFAQAIGVMAQVRISHANLIATKERFDINDKVYKTYNDNLKWAVANQKITGELSRLELDHMRLETAETEIDRLMTLGNYYVAYYRILNSIGVRHIDAKSLGELRNELAQAKVRAGEELEKARRTYDEDRAKRVAANTNLQNLTELETTIVNQPLTKFNDVDFIAIYDATPEKANSMLNEKR